MPRTRLGTQDAALTIVGRQAYAGWMPDPVPHIEVAWSGMATLTGCLARDTYLGCTKDLISVDLLGLSDRLSAGPATHQRLNSLDCPLEGRVPPVISSNGSSGSTEFLRKIYPVSSWSDHDKASTSSDFAAGDSRICPNCSSAGAHGRDHWGIAVPWHNGRQRKQHRKRV